MNDYSFLDHTNIRLSEFITKYSFLLDKPSSEILSGYQYNLLLFKSKQVQLKIYVEHNRIGIDISSLGVGHYDPNLWYDVSAMACFVSKTKPTEWAYDLPRGATLNQVMEQQMTRWQTILNIYFDEIIPFFISTEKLRKMQKTLNDFVQDFYTQRAYSRASKL